ncbi:MAG TPA: hypothetical protein VFU29_08270, partial [Chitinophagaceae bacterium]|nr:hypothetical protein [Chitinophagaceae bacterium]
MAFYLPNKKLLKVHFGRILFSFNLIFEKTDKEQEEYLPSLHHHGHVGKTKKAKTIEKPNINCVPVTYCFRKLIYEKEQKTNNRNNS